MVLVAWLAWFAYCLGVVPTWCYVFGSLRPERSRPSAWIRASLAAVLWPVFLPQHLRYRRHGHPSLADEAEQYLSLQD